MPSLTKDASPALSLDKMFILDQCALIETRCAEVYRYFAKIHAAIPEMEALWNKTADEEDNHAMQFKMLCKLKVESEIKVNADVYSTSAVLKNLTALFEKVNGSTPSPIESLKLAIKLETYLSQYHSNSVTSCSDGDIQNLLNAMMNSDLGHVTMLEKALHKLTDDKDGFTAVLKKLEALFAQMDNSNISPIQVLKLAIKFETFLSQYRSYSADACDDAEMQGLFTTMLGNNSDHVAMLEKALHKLTADQGRGAAVLSV